MNAELGSEVSRLVFQGVVWSTVGKVAFDHWRATHSARQTTALTRRAATRRACHNYQQLHLSMLRTQQAEWAQQRQWQRDLEHGQVAASNRTRLRKVAGAPAGTQPAATGHTERRSHLRAA